MNGDPNAWVANSHPGIRLGVVELARYTEQCAALMAPAEGRGISAQMLEWLAANSIGSCLRASIFRSRLVTYDPAREGNRRELWSEFGFFQRRVGGVLLPRRVDGADWLKLRRPGDGVSDGKSDAREETHEDDPFALDLAVCPVDGKRALRNGMGSGTAVTIAAGRPGAFHEPRRSASGGRKTEEAGASYLIIALGKRLAAHLPRELIKGHALDLSGAAKVAGGGHAAKKGKSTSSVHRLVAYLGSQTWFKQGRRSKASLTALLDECGMEKWASAAKEAGPCRTFSGSGVALGLAVMLEEFGLDAMIAAGAHTHACQLAVAAQACDGEILAIPITIDWSKSGHVTSMEVLAWEGLTAAAFASTDTILVTTGISQHVHLKGVRVVNEMERVVHTRCLSARTKSKREQEQAMHLEHCYFSSRDPRAVEPASKPIGWSKGKLIVDQFHEAFEMCLKGTHPIQVQNRNQAQGKRRAAAAAAARARGPR